LVFYKVMYEKRNIKVRVCVCVYIYIYCLCILQKKMVITRIQRRETQIHKVHDVDIFKDDFD